jgi:hypothetical protein
VGVNGAVKIFIGRLASGDGLQTVSQSQEAGLILGDAGMAERLCVEGLSVTPGISSRDEVGLSWTLHEVK